MQLYLINPNSLFLIIDPKMNYNISFSEMNRLAKRANSRNSDISLAQMRRQAAQLKNNGLSKVKKQPDFPVQTKSHFK